MRLDRFLSNQNVATRREAKELTKAGFVSVNGTPVKDASLSIDENEDTVAVRGVPVVYKKHLYIMLNKPKGVVCATGDKRHQTVIDLLPEGLRRKGLFPAGRLDIDTEGFVLITDDGEFAHRILSPKHHVPKTYHAVLERPVTLEETERFCAGLTLNDGTQCLPAELSVVISGGNPLMEAVLFEGKFHQVKRMFEAVGNRVLELKRVKIGELPLDPNLPLGEASEIMHKERLLILGSSANET